MKYIEDNLDRVTYSEGEAGIDIAIMPTLIIAHQAIGILFGEQPLFSFLKKLKIPKKIPTGLFDTIAKEDYGLVLCWPYGDGRIRIGYKSFTTGQWVLMLDNQKNKRTARKNLRKLLESKDKNLVKIK